MMLRARAWIWVAGAILSSSLAGCGAEDSNNNRSGQSVTGTVTFDGKPLEAGRIRFQNEKDSAEAAITEGSYEIPQSEGPPPGSYTVYIVSSQEVPDLKEGELPGVPEPAKPEKIPPKYNASSTLTAQVKEGDNAPISFVLESAK